MLIKEIQDAVIKIAPKYPVYRIDLFGSCANGDDDQNSDIDLLVYFNDNIASLFDLSNLKFDIQDELNMKVDIVAGPIKVRSYLIIDKKVRLYESERQSVN